MRNCHMQVKSMGIAGSRALSCVLLLGTIAAWFPNSAMAADATAAPFKVGVTYRQFIPQEPYDWRAAKTHALRAIVWYPAAASADEQPQWMGAPQHPLAAAGKAAPEAALAPSPTRFPLIVISHGTGGSAPALAWLGTRLAAHGFIVAAVNHPGNNALEPYTPQGFSLWWLRAEDLSAVIDGMLADREFSARVDGRRIGAAGFSLGGYTMIEIAGGRTSPRFFDLCSSHPRDRRCASPPEFPTLVPTVLKLLKTDPGYRAAVRGAGANYGDTRVRAVLAIAPALAAVFRRDSLRRIAIPAEIVAGSADRIEPVSVNAEYFATHIPRSRLVLFPGAGHYTFFATCTSMGRKAQPELCEDAPGIDRQRVHERAANLAVAFFSRQLK